MVVRRRRCMQAYRCVGADVVVMMHVLLLLSGVIGRSTAGGQDIPIIGNRIVTMR